MKLLVEDRVVADILDDVGSMFLLTDLTRDRVPVFTCDHR